MRALIPNLLTASRGLAGPGIAVLVMLGDQHELAFALFLAAILTDLVDGALARWLGATTELGRWLDPLADKLLADTTWLTLGLMGWAPWWLVAPMLVRDLLVGLGWLALGVDKTPPPSMAGRMMVSFEGVALPVLLFRNPWLDVHWPSVGVAIGSIALALAVLSGLRYLARILLRATRPTGPRAASALSTPPWPRHPSTRT